MAAEDEPVYCLCRLPYDDSRFMIECDVCNDWFHGNCVGVQEHQASDIEIYHCPNCQKEHGPLTLKKRRNWHRHDYSETDSSKAVQTGTVTFIKELKNRNFPSADEIPILRVKGSDLTLPHFEENGFDVPILVENKEGLEIQVPPADFSIQDIENHVGSMREIDVIDVARQEDYKMLMREWTEYYNSPDRDKIFNVISLEFSNTKLSDLVVPPKIVRQVSWVNNMWPDNLPDDCTYSRPEVQKYCLMGVQDSFTDFHIDFGGTSVWYHVLRGEKVFYLIRPTPANMDLYEGWISSSNQSETFFGDQVDSCYKSVVTAGQTLFIPTGWIHAVFTPVDTLVFGGNFLHTYNVPLQLKVYEIERHVKTPEKYLFPSFETICWYAAKYVLDILKDCEEDGRKASNYVISGAKSLAQHLKSWTQRKDFAKSAKHDVPEHIQYGKLLKELVKVSRNFEVQAALKPKVERKRRKKNIPTPKQMESLDILHQHTTEKLQELQKQEHKNEEQKNVYAFPDDPPSPPPTSLKMRIPKAGAFIDNVLKTVKEEEENLNPSDISSLKLKVSNGRIVGDNVKPEVVNLGKFQPLMTDFDDDGGDSDPDQLVVDESPAVRKKSKPGENNSRTTMKPGSLKLKLSFSGKYPNESEGQEAPEGAPTAKRQRKTPAAKKEKKPATTTTPTTAAATAGGPKAKGGGPKATAAAAGKKETKKAPARTTKGKGKQNKDQLIDNQTCVETPVASSGLTVPTPELLNSLLSGDPLTLKVKGDYSLLGSQSDTFLPLEQAGLTTEPPKNEPKGKKPKGEPKGKRGATKKAKAEALLLAKEEPGGAETKVATTTVKETPNRKTKAKDAAAAKAANLLDGKTEAGTPLDLPFLETRFEPLLEIKSEAPAKKGKGESKRGRGGGGGGAAAKKKEEGAKGRGNSKKGAAAAVSSATDGSDKAAKSQDSTTSPDDFYEDPLVINLQDTKPKKGGRGKAAPKRAKANKAAADSADDGGTPGKKAKTEGVGGGGGGKKSKNVPAGNKGKTEPPLLVNLKKDPQSEKPANQTHRNVPPTSNQTDSSKMAWSDLPSMSSPPPQQQHERKHLTSPQPDLQSLMAIRANLQSLTSPRSDSQQTFIRQDSPSLKQGSPLKSPHSDPFSCLSKKSGGSSTSSSLTLSPSLSTSASSSKHFTQKKTDSVTSTSLSSLSKKSDSLFLLPKKPDPLSLVPKKPDPLSLIPPKKQDPLSLIPKKRDPLSLLPPKPDPLSLKLTQSDSSLLSLKNPDTAHNNNNNTNVTTTTTTTTNNNNNSNNNNKHPLSLLHSNNKTNNKSNNKKSGLEGKPDPLSEAFFKNKEPLTPKDNSSLMSGPKSELASSKKTKTSADSTTTTAAMKSMTTTTNTTTATTTALTTTCDKLTVCDEVTNNDGGEKKESVSQMAVDIKLDQLASILKSESLLSKARLSTLKPVEGPVTPGKQDLTKDKVKDKQADNSTAATPAVTAGLTTVATVVGSQTKAVEKLLPTKEKVPSSPVGKLKQSAEHTSRKKASTNPVSSAVPTTPTTTTPTTKSKPEKILSLRAELHAKQLAMQAKIAEEEGGGAGGKSVTETEQSKRMNMPTIRGGLNCGIADILEASGYGTETDFQVDEDVSAPSPTMRDAIQGMLSMSRMGSPQLFAGGAALAGGKGRKQWSGPHAEEEEQLGVCYKDDEYIYPSLDISDDEDSHIFKPRGRQKKDETWNPKARVMVTSEKRERMARDNARRESMENTLAVTAAKYETMAKSKSGNRKRLKPEELVEEMSAAPKSPNLTVSQDSAPGNPAAATPTSSKLGGTTSLAVLSSPTVATTENGSSATPQPSTSSSSTPSKGGVSTTISAATPSTSEAVASTSAGAPRPPQPPFSSPQSCPSKPKKPKKGFATAKQRLGRILKIHKMRF
ncbi:histone lysine demethylase PHF8-like [Argonauta hians]